MCRGWAPNPSPLTPSVKRAAESLVGVGAEEHRDGPHGLQHLPWSSQSRASPSPRSGRVCSYKSGSFSGGRPTPSSLAARRSHYIHSGTSQRKLEDERDQDHVRKQRAKAFPSYHPLSCAQATNSPALSHEAHGAATP